MKIIILRIPDTTTKKQVRSFVKSILNKCFHIPFTAKLTLTSCEIVQIKEQSGVTDTHALLGITPDNKAKKVIRRLNGKRLNGKMVHVRQYRERGGGFAIVDPMNERRRKGLIVSTKSLVRIEGLEKYSKKGA